MKIFQKLEGMAFESIEEEENPCLVITKMALVCITILVTMPIFIPISIVVLAVRGILKVFRKIKI